MMASSALDHVVVVVADEVECCKLHYTDCDFGGIEVMVVESVVDLVVDVAVGIEEVEGVHSSWKGADDAPGDDDDVVAEEEGKDSHGEEEGAFQVHLVDIVDVEHGEEAVHVPLLLLLFQQVQQCHNS